MSSNINCIYGCPGTGKTTYLINKVEECLDRNILPQRIGFFSFTREASLLAIKRIANKGWDISRFVYFRTIHSYTLMQAETKHNLMNELDFKKAISGHRKGLFDKINLSRITRKPLSNIIKNPVEFAESQILLNKYRQYCTDKGVIDFTSLLENHVDNGYDASLDVLFVDEAQDLSRLQWEVIFKLAKKVPEVYIVGDDDQAIFEWAGADLETFLNLEGKKTFLSQSYRVPPSIHKVACNIINKVKTRQAKNYYPHEEVRGVVKRHFNLNSLDLVNKKYLALVRSNYQVNQLKDIPNLDVRTIHSSKGTEADNVVVFTETSPNIQRERKISLAKYESEQRVWYVAVTRAKKELHIIEHPNIYSMQI